MRKLGNYLAVSIGFVLLVSVVAVSIPQTGHSTPATADKSDVRVVNTTAEPVPVAVQGSPSVSINNIPGNPIAVTPQGTTHVAGTVTVANQPAAPAAPIPIQITIPVEEQPTISGIFPIAEYTFFTVPEGKVLTVEYAQLHFPNLGVGNVRWARLTVVSPVNPPVGGPVDRATYHLPEIDGPTGNRIFGGPMKLLVPSGFGVRAVLKVDDIPDWQGTTLQGSITGYLSDAPTAIAARNE